MQVDEDGDIRFSGCKSESCLSVEDNFILSGGSITFGDCEDRGMEAAGNVNLKKGASMSFKGCGNLQVDGGALFVKGSLDVEDEASLEAQSCVSFRGAGIYCGGHWSFPTFSINFAAPHLGFQILQVLVQGLKAEEEKRRVQSQHRWKLQLGKVQCFETSVFKSL